MLTDEQVDTLTGIADAVSRVAIQGTDGHRATMSEDAVEAVLSLYKLGAIKYVGDNLTILTNQFTTCCNLTNDAFNGMSVVVDYDRLAQTIGLQPWPAPVPDGT